MASANRIFCANPECRQMLLSTFKSCPSCGGTRFVDESAGGNPKFDAMPEREHVVGNFGNTIKASPVLDRNNTNIISKVEAIRDEIYDNLVYACNSEGVVGMILKSHPYSPDVQVSCECWLPHSMDTALRERVISLITVRPCEFQRYEYEIDVNLTRGDRTRKIQSVRLLDRSAAIMLVRYLIHRETKLKFECLRTEPWQIWKPKNGVKNKMGLARTMMSMLLRERFYTASTGRPDEEPRKLLRLDSWQTLITGAANDAEALKSDIRRKLESGFGDGLRVNSEKIWYRGVNGKEEREQLVVTFRRAIAFVHVYVYDVDLFVGWDAHVNGGTWVEKRVGLGRDPLTNTPCELNSIEVGWHTPTEYDVVDAETVIERVHTIVTQLVKRIIADRKIDQEVDFKIAVRGERQSIVGKQEAEKRKGRSLFRREE